MYCPKCGTDNLEDAKICQSCGQSLANLSENLQKPKTSALAIWSFVLALTGLLFLITYLPALICGIISLVEIGKSDGRLKGKGLAIAGIVISAVFTVVLLLGILMPALAKVRVLSQRIMCGTNLSGISKAVISYTAGHNNMYPPAENWCDLLIKDYNVAPRQFCCPGSHAKEGQSSFAININVAGKKASDIPPDTVVIFETNPGLNPVGDKEILNTENHKGDGCNILFADGSVKFIKSDAIDDLRWSP